MTQQMNQNQASNPIQQMKQVQKQILSNFELLNNLNSKYKTQTQKGFITTFLNVMERMSNDLIDAQEQYRNIDMEIEADKKCVALAKQLNFFKTQCIQLRKQLDLIKQQLNNQRNKNFILTKQSQHLSKALTKKVKEIQKYKTLSKQKNVKNDKLLLKNIQPWRSINLDELPAPTQAQKFMLSNKPSGEGIFQQKIKINQSNRYSNRLRFKSRGQKINQQYRPVTKSFNRGLFTRQQLSTSSNKLNKLSRTFGISQLLN